MPYKPNAHGPFGGTQGHRLDLCQHQHRRLRFQPEKADFHIHVAEEFARARRKHEKPMNSLHEGFAVLMEEFEEFKAEVFKQSADRDRISALKELIQIAAMAQRIAEDVICTPKFRLC